MVVHNGHRLAISLASRRFSSTRALGESWGGVHQLQTIKQLSDDIDEQKLGTLATDLAAIGKAVSNLTSVFKGFDEGTVDGFSAPDINVEDETIREGWSTSSAVSFVALAFETVRMEHEDSAALSVISKILRSIYLHREIREKGGAYGGFALYSPEDGLFCFASYRDPHIVSTLKAFDNAAAFVRSGNFSDEDVNEAVLQVCSEIDKPDPPGPAARKAFYRKIISLSDEMRGRFKSELLSLTRSKVMQAAEKYFDAKDTIRAVAVISGEEKLNAANKKLAGSPLKLYRI